MTTKIFTYTLNLSILVLLYLSSLYNYLLFHNFVEIFSIIIASGIFIIAWNSKKYIKNNYLIYVAIAYLFIGFLDLLHTLSYKGMQIFTDYDYYANQLWIAARFLESLTLLIGFSLINKEKPINTIWVFLGYFFVTTCIILSIFTYKIFPVCFIEGKGLTPFKKISEYIISFIIVIDMILAYKYKAKFEPYVFKMLVFSLICTIISELAFTFYISNYGFSNLVGHYFKLFSFYAIYKAIIETGIVNPYDLIFRELSIKEKHLAEAKQIADRANQAKSDFLARMSHELRTPLNGILGYAQILKRDDRLLASHKEGVLVIERSGHHLLSLINDVLDIAKIESRKMELYPCAIQFDELLENIAKLIEIRAMEKKIRFTIEKSPDLPFVIYADEKRLSQILLNLLGNAVKFTDHGEVTFHVSAETTPLDLSENTLKHRKLYFKITDTGIGISQEQLSTIFDPFTQVGDTKKMREGTGLGLTICRQLVELMGSELHVESNPEQGSTFWFELSVEQGNQHLPKVIHDKIIGVKGASRTILVVDDKYENRQVLTQMLSLLGFNVKEAENGKIALSLFSEMIPDLIFMDIVMPEMDGYEASLKIRQQDHGQAVKIIACSASVSTLKMKTDDVVLFDDFIGKPVQFEQIYNSIERSLNIEWIYRPTDTTDIEKISKEHDEIPLVSDLQLLHEYAVRGDILSIRKELDRIESVNSGYAHFVKSLRELAMNFQIKAIRTSVEQYLEGKQ
ncbi:MAG: response regulator [Desulfobacterales bacterium]|nr:response regulator [Desulfobacterales bacterium]